MISENSLTDENTSLRTNQSNRHYKYLQIETRYDYLLKQNDHKKRG